MEEKIPKELGRKKKELARKILPQHFLKSHGKAKVSQEKGVKVGNSFIKF